MRPEAENSNCPEASREVEPPRPEHAVAVIICDRRIFLIQRSNDDDWKHQWALPSETLEADETSEEAIGRVGPEELGVELEVKQKLEDFRFEGHTDHLFISDLQGELQPDSDEVENQGFFTFDQAKDMTVAFGFDQVIADLHKAGLIR